MNDRRSRPQDVLSFGPFDLLPPERLLKKANEPIPLGGRALDILIALAERAGEVVTHKELIERVWPDVNVEETNLRVHISALRKALGDGRDGARYISSVAGRGYCLVAPIKHSLTEQCAPPPSITDAEGFKKLPPRLSRMVGREDTVRPARSRNRYCAAGSVPGIGRIVLDYRRGHSGRRRPCCGDLSVMWP